MAETETKDLAELRRTQLLKLMIGGLEDLEIAELTALNVRDVANLRKTFLSLEVKDILDEQAHRVRFAIVSKNMKAVETLSEIMEDKKVSPRVRQISAQDLLDRGGQKPVDKSMVAVQHSLDPEVLKLAKQVMEEEKNGRGAKVVVESESSEQPLLFQ